LIEKHTINNNNMFKL